MSDTIEAGRELDTLVAERVMGWSHIERKPRQYKGFNGFANYFGPHGLPPEKPFNEGFGLFDVPTYSTNIADAWRVLDRMIERGYEGTLHRRAGDDGLTLFLLDAEGEPTGEYAYYCAEKMPLAICRAALNAVAAKTPVASPTPERG